MYRIVTLSLPAGDKTVGVLNHDYHYTADKACDAVARLITLHLLDTTYTSREEERIAYAVLDERDIYGEPEAVPIFEAGHSDALAVWHRDEDKRGCEAYIYDFTLTTD